VSTNRIVSIIDDDLDITILFHEALKSIRGITVVTFTDPIKALEHFHVNEHAYLVVISDFKMPGLNGMELLKKIRDSHGIVKKDKGFESLRKNDIDDCI
jgi:DNA-binding NtrC family response regulator